jgi:1-acyl-sn-glycerol-3-phosphate acyltransferase
VLYFALHFAALASTTVAAFCDFGFRRLKNGPLRLSERAAWLHRWSAFLLPKLGIRIEAVGAPLAGTLIASNHLSYLDIIVFSAIAPCVFVAKQEVRRWPVYGLLAHMAGTSFLDRARAADAARVGDEVAGVLGQGVRVVVFPEGTSTDGSSVLAFRPALFEPAVAGGFPVLPACLRYEVDHGSPEQEVCYWGEMTFVPHLMRLLTKKTIRATVRMGEARTYATRRDAAQATHQEVSRLLHGEINDPRPMISERAEASV